ncbi:PEP-CTERM sorting domain-containing protein [Seongchinamella unica]|uniref:PEP-CTERM sorting domain-containing protein n=1 Tax=Seongchinamella unica TaxID=2547392 RepID=A0A4R5LQ97_9GAMM|nr:hypothetical protein [Seongchinamella unica]TDG12732.1 PEP-CTERM sorting domain-containing protein [Seongchinamella unica]
MITKLFRSAALLVCCLISGFSFADVAVYGANNQTWNEEVRDKIAAAAGGALGAVDFFDAGVVTPTLVDLQNYTAVLVYSDGGFADPVALGDALADYADAGGTVVLSTFAFNINPIAGRLVTDSYLPVTLGPQSSPGGLTLVPVDAGNGLLAGVSSFAGGSSSYHNTVSLEAGATLVAEWSNGVPLIAVLGNVIALNMYPPSSDSRSDFWDATTEGDIMMSNALGFVGVAPPPAAPVAPPKPVPVMPLSGLGLMIVGILVVARRRFMQR